MDATESRLEELYREHRDRLLALCRHLLGEGEAEDAVQDTFGRVARHIDRLDTDARAYLVVTARSVCFDRLRARRRAGSLPLSAQPLASPSPVDAVLSRLTLHTALSQLSDADRQLLLSAAQGRPLTDLAADLALPSNTAAQRLSRARRRLRRLLESLSGLLPAPLMRRHSSSTSLVSRPLSGIPEPWIAAVQMTALLVLPLTVVGTGAPPSSPYAAQSSVQASADGMRVFSPRSPDPTVQHIPGRSSDTSHVAPVGQGSADASAEGAPPSAQAALPLQADGITGPPSNAQPAETLFSSFTPSPHYMSDHTVFAVGTDQACTGQCTVAFRSTDAGHSWQQLPSRGLVATRILLPPSYPSDPTIFASGDHTLARSGDNGTTFTTIFADTYTVPFEVDPTSPVGGARIVIGQAPLLVYDDMTRSVALWAALPTTVTAVDSITLGPGTPDLYVRTGQASGGLPDLYACVVNVRCAYLRSAGDASLSPWASATFYRDHTLFFLGRDGLEEVDVARNHSAAIPWQAAMRAVWTVIPASDFADSHRVDVIAGPSPSEVWESVDGAAFRESMAQSTFSQIYPDRITVLPDGHILGAWIAPPNTPDGRPAWGIACSTDGGRTWADNTC